MIILGSGNPSNSSEDMQKFAQFLCTDQASRDKVMRAKHNLRPHQQSWITETREYRSLYTAIILYFYYCWVVL